MNSWYVECYGSGTVIVKTNNHNIPHFYVHATETNNDVIRRNTAIDLEVWLNHGRMPVWVNTLQLGSETYEYLTNGDDINISVVGPMMLPENDNGALNWISDISHDSQLMRLNLIMRLKMK